jgi:uncharacterized protein (TIRG00374 family)
MVKKRVLLISLSVVILIGIIIYADPVLLLSILSKSDLKYVILAFAVSNISMLIRVLKWRVLLKDVGFLELFPIQVFGMTVSNFTPGKIAEPTKAVILKMKKGLAVSETLSTVIWERIMDVLVMIMFSLIAIPFLTKTFFLISSISIAAFLGIIIVFLIILYNKNIGIKIFNFIRRFPVLKKISGGFIKTFYKSRIEKKRLVGCFLLTVIPWFFEGVVLYLSLLALGVYSNPLILAGIVALSLLIGIASSLPGGLGSTEAVMVIVLGMIGIGSTIGIAGIMLARFLTFWYGAFVGALSFFYLSRKIDLSALKI